MEEFNGNMDTQEGRDSVMSPSSNLRECNENDTKELLIRAVLQLWGESPREAVSVRSIARKAGAAPSAIDYHFGSLEHLYGATQCRALDLADAWMHRRLGELEPLAGTLLTLPARSAIIAGTIDDWNRTERQLAMAARESVAASRSGGSREPHLRWTCLWLNFWQQAAAHIGMAPAADMLAMFHDGEGAQHLMCWNRTLDLALLAENVSALLAFSDNGEMLPSPVRIAYRTAVKTPWLDPAMSDSVPSPLDRAAATILQEQGIAGLTFRNVADQAGETLGRTSWHFGTKTALLERAFEQLYREVAGQPPPTGSVMREEMLGQITSAVSSGEQPILRAFDEIILHIARSQEHIALRGAIRAFRDPAANWVLASLLASGEPVSPALASAFSSICRGLDHYSLAHAGDGVSSSLEDLQNPAPAEMADRVLRQLSGL